MSVEFSIITLCYIYIKFLPINSIVIAREINNERQFLIQLKVRHGG